MIGLIMLGSMINYLTRSTLAVAIGALVLKIGYTPFFICLGLLDVIGAGILWTVIRAAVKAAEAVEV
jgi:ACS family hexuronate transporter-like MFS transporter